SLAFLPAMKMKTTLAMVLIATSLALSGCTARAGVTSAASMPPASEVSVVTVGGEDIPIYSEYSAQTFARDLVEVRGRVDGYIQKRLFEVGSDVQKGQVLYELDPRPYQAEVAKATGDVRHSEAGVQFARNQVALAQAQADLAEAEANLAKSRQDVTRLEPLVKEE